MKLGMIRELVYESKSTANICGRGWSRKSLDSIKIIRQKHNGFNGDAESSKSDASALKAEFAWIENILETPIVLNTFASQIFSHLFLSMYR